MLYEKPALSIDEQLNLLVSRGLRVRDRERARHYLAHLSYYRLRGYWLPFEQASTGSSHQFRPETDFEDVVALYVFDRRLKLLLMDLVEQVEVSVRARWVNSFAMRYGPHGHLAASNFRDASRHSKCLASLREELGRSRETFVEHYRRTYHEPPSPPLWAACEVMSLGQLSQWIQNLGHRADRQAIAGGYGLDESVFCSFLHHLTNVRNLCAHHGRIWNRRFTFTMKLPKSPSSLAVRLNPFADRNVFNTLVVLDHLIEIISPDSRWHRDLLEAMKGCPAADPLAMGFPADWEDREPWSRVVSR